jgi:hypothetical protein
MKLFKFYAGTTLSLIALVVAIALMIRYQAYLGYVGGGVVILMVIIAGLGVWYLVEKILHHRHQRVELARRLELEEEAQSAAQRREQQRFDLERQERAQQLDLAIRRYTLEEHLALTRLEPAQHGYAVVLDRTTGSYLQIPTQQPAQLAERAASKQTEASVNEQSIPTAPTFRAMCHLIRGAAKLILCYGTEGPIFGTVDDLLSYGAEVIVWDPHRAMADLARLNIRTIHMMPLAAGIFFGTLGGKAAHKSNRSRRGACHLCVKGVRIILTLFTHKKATRSWQTCGRFFTYYLIVVGPYLLTPVRSVWSCKGLAMILAVTSTTRQGLVAQYAHIGFIFSYSHKLKSEGVWHE